MSEQLDAAFDMLVDQSPEISRAGLLDTARIHGPAAILEVPIESLPYDALNPNVVNHSPTDIQAERKRRLDNMQKRLADISLYDIAI